MEIVIKNQRGSVLAIVLLCLSVMLVMIYVLAQVVMTQQKSTVNYADIKLAENYARAAMYQAEKRVYKEIGERIENPSITCEDSVRLLSGNHNGASCLMLRRGAILKKFGNDMTDITAKGETCNSGENSVYRGYCYKPSGNSGVIYNSDQTWRPWELTGGVKPCDSYSSTPVPLIDDKRSRYSIPYDANDKSLCANPRYMIEPINLDFRGKYVKRTDALGGESDVFIQNNLASMNTYNIDEALNYNYDSNDNQFPSKNNLTMLKIISPTLYRITVVAFGKSGDTKVTLQEIVMIDDYTSNTVYPRISDDTSKNEAYRIVRVSTRWIR